jgi:hypothetical protein
MGGKGRHGRRTNGRQGRLFRLRTHFRASKAQEWAVAEPALIVKKDAVRGESLNRLYRALSHAGGHAFRTDSSSGRGGMRGLARHEKGHREGGLSSS